MLSRGPISLRSDEVCSSSVGFHHPWIYSHREHLPSSWEQKSSVMDCCLSWVGFIMIFTNCLFDSILTCNSSKDLAWSDMHWTSVVMNGWSFLSPFQFWIHGHSKSIPKYASGQIMAVMIPYHIFGS